jgi:SWIM zinc finger
MDYAMISKIQKAKDYALEKERIRIETLSVSFDGKNNPHFVQLIDGAWQCDCSFFQSRGTCSHTMALEILLEGMLPELVPTV